jgi:hypothetical protein
MMLELRPVSRLAAEEVSQTAVRNTTLVGGYPSYAQYQRSETRRTIIRAAIW